MVRTCCHASRVRGASELVTGLRLEGVSVLVIEADVRFPTYSVGSVARGLMTYAGCPVILVK